MKVINEHAQVELFSIGDKSVLIVDDFLKNPGALRKFAYDTYAKAKGKKNLLNVGERVMEKVNGAVLEIYPDEKKINKKFPNMIVEIAELIKNYLGKEIASHYNFQETSNSLELQKETYFNLVLRAPQFLPHVDAAHISSFIYLNPSIQCYGGTGIYRHIPTGKLYTDQSITSLEWLCQEPLKRPLTESTDEWCLECMVEMKYNRMVAFNGSFIHKIYWPDASPYGKSLKESRLTLNNFFWYR